MKLRKVKVPKNGKKRRAAKAPTAQPAAPAGGGANPPSFVRG